MLVATPGRLQDLVDEGTLDLSSVQFLVLDEADRMLGLGFVDLVKTLIGKMPKAGQRQTCTFSATLPASVHHLATQFMKEPVHVGIGSLDAELVANAAIRQEVEVCWNERGADGRRASGPAVNQLHAFLAKHFAAAGYAGVEFRRYDGGTVVYIMAQDWERACGSRGRLMRALDEAVMHLFGFPCVYMYGLPM